MLLRSLPVGHPNELVFLETAGSAGTSGPPPYPYFSRLRSETKTLSGTAAFCGDELRIEVDGRPEQVFGQMASGNYFQLLGVPPLLGRVMTLEDERLDPPVAVISEQYWRRRFGSDPSAIGKSIRFGTRSFVIVGVTPAGFFGLQPGARVDVSFPVTVEEKLVRDPSAFWLQGIVGHLRPGVARAQAQAEADALFRSFMVSTRYPADIAASHFDHMEASPAARGTDVLRSRFSRPLYALCAIAGLLLLLAIANIANLLLSRGIGRAREFAIRLAAGASRGRIVRQLLTETMVLFLLGAVPGVLCTQFGVGLVVLLFRQGRRALEVDASVNWHILAFSFLVTLAAALLAGLLPACRAFRTEPEQAIKDGSPGAGEARGAGRLSQLLVAFQFGLSLVLLVSALLFARTLGSLRHVDTGFRDKAVLTMSLHCPQDHEGAKCLSLWTRALEAVRALPGVRSAAVSIYTPLSGRDRGGLVKIRGYVPATWEDAVIHINQVSEGYFESLGMTLVRGRFLTDHDTDGSPKVALINESAARKFFGGRDPIGESLEFERKGGVASYRIVGLVRDTKHMNLREATPRFAFLPMRQPIDVEPRVTLLVAADVAREELDLLPPVRSVLGRIDPGILVSDVITMRRQLESTLLTERLLSGFSVVFGALAMLLAVIGLYGVLSYRVSRQRREIGIRMALGASSSNVAAGVVRQGAVVVGYGLLAGLPIAVMAARVAGSMLWGVSASDPIVYAVCSALLSLVALVSAYIPARRAAAVQPGETLRHS